jgi:phosphoglycerate dehydrogenase-like enzyme
MSEVLIVGPFAAAVAARLGALPAGVRLASAESFDQAGLNLTEVRALIVLPQMLDQALLARMPKLEWLQTLTAGIDSLVGLDLGGIALSTMGGVHAPQMSELAFLYMLAFARDVRGILTRQAAAEWRPSPQHLLAGAHAVIVGVGRIAEALARRCRAFDMRVTGVSGSRREAPGFNHIEPLDRLTATVAGADYLIVLAPYSSRSHHLISREVIAALPPTAVLVNIARGPVVDEAALIDALSAKRIAGAGLDVFTQEPLPPDHPFWCMSNVIVTPHIGGLSTRLIEQMTPLIAENVGRWFASPRRLLINQVIPS